MSKKEKSPYDSNGRWIEERGRVKGAIRRVFRLSPQMKEVLNAARVELPPALKKDGTPGKKNQVRYRCACCGKLFSRDNVQVDHIEPVVPLWKSEADMTYDEMVVNIICGKDNLQVVCSTPLKKNGGEPSCHRLKTNEENYIRDYLAKLDSNVRIQNIDAAKRAYMEYAEEQAKKKREKEERKQARLLKKQQKRG